MMKTLENYINGEWQSSISTQYTSVHNPATQEVIAQVPSGPDTVKDVEKAIQHAQKAYLEWKDVPAMKRVQPLFKMKMLLEDHKEEIAKLITNECGKTYAESLGEIQRAIENVEVACATYVLNQSEFSENIAPGIDEFMIRQPLGVCACITPFNFPGMIPFWFLPYAIATGNSFILKPSEKVPATMQYVFDLIHKNLDLPKGLLSLVHGGKDSVDSLLRHPDVKAISFVGSTPIAKYIYSEGAKYGKRVQAQGGAKNPIVIMPDADIDMTTKIITDSVYGCAGQRCLAASLVITVGDDKKIKDALVEAAKSRKVGYGLEDGIEMGPVISQESKTRIQGLIQKGIAEGANFLVDGTQKNVSGFDRGNFLYPTILENVPLDKEIISTEIFGPVMSLLNFKSMEDSIRFINSGRYGNMACIFTQDGLSARQFRSEAMAGNIGINVGVAAPVAQFPFSGWKESFFGDLHAQGRHGIEFYTQTKVVIERWPKTWSRTF
ncbi:MULTISPECIES: CoA-acylating methylmalonate-semialdehyde dehydrogenase [Chryseobacterium]|uniref:methylmalonate-semialdehyde dehydrogenase (CoA acylating) n=1 Tax=Chryseobacterium rhizosphaerae TaxID=395937 RepID=A0AAE3YB34_9FLAO|nr:MULTISPECIES: CoA-acylating methylmalonate-semialdehyde dehydrogenase [Chryseobacterium]MDR6528339.1 malonate-semialdehyde dehydrogenase (acetylating)/methylmalonate-semialdehyde dehydrogenase [Chryseobacterium rhizosphaerae]